MSCRNIVQTLKWNRNTRNMIYPVYLSILHFCLVDDFGGLLIIFSEDRAPMVRAAAVSALGHLLTQPQIVESIAAAPGLASTSEEWWQAVLHSMVDDDDEVVGAAFSTVNQILLLKQSSREQAPSPSTAFVEKSYDKVLNLLKESLGPVLNRASELEAGAHVSHCQGIFLYHTVTFANAVGICSLRDLNFWGFIFSCCCYCLDMSLQKMAKCMSVQSDTFCMFVKVPVAYVLSALVQWLAVCKPESRGDHPSCDSAFRWCIGSIGSFLETMLPSVDGAAVVAGSRALLEVIKMN